MSQTLTLKIAGLYTHPNTLSSAPDGALAVADNIVIDRENEAEPRRGFDRLTYSYSNNADRASKLFTYQDKILSHYTGDKLAYYNDASGWIDYSGTYTAPTSAKIRAAEANNNFYFTTSSGIKLLDVYNGSVMSAGMVKGLDVTASLTGASGFLANNTQVAYRVVWGYKDVNNNLVLGAPSQRSVVSNSAGATRDVSLVITVPSSITANDFFQVYRSGQSASSTTEPNDEMQLVYEANPTAGEITARSITFTDSTPDDLRGASLYTNSTQEGLAQSNEEPPFAKDVASFKNCLFFGNTKSKHRLYFTILSVGGSSGIQLNDTITIAGTTYTAKAAETVASREYALVTGGTPSQNIKDTALSLVRVINQNSTNTTVYAYYLSGYSDLPGKILVEERSLGGNSFSATVSARGAAFSPTLPTSGTTVSSTNDQYLNGVYISKQQQPEAVPLTNVLFVGSASKEILRTIALRDSLFIFKEDGIFRITGETPSNFRADLIDNSTILLAPESAVVLNNTIFCLSTQGVVSVSDSGVQVVSRNIETSITELFGRNLTTLKDVSFGISYESERKYILFTITNAADTYPTQAYVYNTFTSTWTRWPLNKGCGIVNPVDDKLYLANADSKYIVQERKSYSFRDYIDEGSSYTISSYSNKTITISGGITGIEVGDLLYQSASVNSPVVSIDSTAGTVTVYDSRVWALSTVTVYKAINCIVEWVPQSSGNPGLLKHYREASLLFKNNYFPSATIGFYSDLSQSLEETSIEGTYGGLWGLFAWGNASWGGVQRQKVIRTYVPLEKSRCSQLSIRFTHKVGYSMFRLDGVSLQLNAVSERMIR